MKNIIILGDGMSDYPVPELNGLTPLDAAHKPAIDLLSTHGELGLVKTIPNGIQPGSDTANLSVLGFDPSIYYTGRSPIEAVSMGINLESSDVTFRCNLVTLSEEDEYENKTMIDYGSDEISTEESSILIKSLQDKLGTDTITFYPGISYRHCVVWKVGPSNFSLVPPHDILEKKVKDYLPAKIGDSEIIYNLMINSISILKNHPVNKSRIERGLNPASSIWLWGNGKKLTLPSFKDKFGVDGAVISAVDLIKGIGICAGMKSIDVEGATGNIHTNFTGKANAAIKALDDYDFVYLHIEAPDECGHRHEVENKVRSIELIDEFVVAPIFKAMQKYDDFRIMILPDHPTPLSLRTHTSDPVPYIFYRHSNSNIINGSGKNYTEKNAAETGVYIEHGYTLIDKLMSKDDK